MPSEQLVPALDDDIDGLSVIIVTHDAAAYIDRCLASVWAAADRLACEVIVVDNCSADDTVAIVRRDHPDVHLIEPSCRGGFARNVNVGLRAAGGKHVLVLNPDTEIEPDALCRSLEYMEQHPEVGALGARLADESGHIESSFRTFPTLWTAICEALFLDRLFPQSQLFARRTMRYADPSTEHRVDWLTGAYLWIRREVIDGTDEHPPAGYLDESYVLFVEDTDWCRRMRRAGWEVAYVPSARALHHKGSGSGWSAWRYALNCRGTRRYFIKHHGWAAAAAYEAILLVGLVLRCLVSAVTAWLPGGRRRERARRCHDYARLTAMVARRRLEEAVVP